MGLLTSNLKTGVTATSPTGGTEVNFTSDGVEVAGGLHLAAASQPFITRQNITVKTRNPKLLADGSYTKAKREVLFVSPMVLAVTGKTVFNLVRIEVEYHPEITDANLTDLLSMGSQVLYDADFTSFLKTGSLA